MDLKKWGGHKPDFEKCVCVGVGVWGRDMSHLTPEKLRPSLYVFALNCPLKLIVILRL